eukprot:CAMPEP_0202880130 /NCGR_PEP_ID=MMETSP1391-20130828/34650_1 /ASSEMBLY_ACC=CAM_ASM_000867 /TAXON_ID=1034604 /ORGANISM="Chlamydomonas leiostraca, Strain SAG 11-49" /LENGTH=157 /DNA_ID=CAMNT_0049562587 /DNA_START=11 /DNA_END=481 /DNA_ORIENTATION=-
MATWTACCKADWASAEENYQAKLLYIHHTPGMQPAMVVALAHNLVRSHIGHPGSRRPYLLRPRPGGEGHSLIMMAGRMMKIMQLGLAESLLCIDTAAAYIHVSSDTVATAPAALPARLACSLALGLSMAPHNAHTTSVMIAHMMQASAALPCVVGAL